MDFKDLKSDFLKHKATYIIVAVTSLVWIGQLMTFGNQVGTGLSLFEAGAIFVPAIQADPIQLWRLFTALFLHIDWTHILMNMLTLFFIGRQVEVIFGWKSFSLIYIFSGIFGNAMTLLFAPSVISAGASTALFGLFAAVVGLGFFTEMPVLKAIGRTFGFLIVINLAVNIFQLGTVNIWGHLGGALGGLLLSAIFPPKELKRAIPKGYRLISTIVLLALFMIFIILPLANA